MSEFKKLTDQLFVSAQLSLDDIQAAKAAGFKTIINNRPNNESDDQPDGAEIENAVRNAGLAYYYQPVVSGQITDENVDGFGQLLSSVEGPTLAFCRTGTRCTFLWALSQAAHEELPELANKAASAGYDLSGLMPRLLQRKA